MRVAHALFVIAFGTLGSGCALVEDGARNAIRGVTTTIENHREKDRNRRWAEIAWQGVCSDLGPNQRTGDYADGFKAGYAEYLYRGGDAEPPLVAPLRYRHFRYQNPQGYQAVEEWFAGYRHGAATARDSGARRWIVGPSSLMLEHPEPNGHFKAPPPAVLPTPRPRELPKPAPESRLDAKPPNRFDVEVVPTVTPPEQERVKVVDVAPPPVVVEPVAMPPMRLRITEVREAEIPAQRARILEVNPAPMERLQILGISEAQSNTRPSIQSIKVAPIRGEPK